MEKLNKEGYKIHVDWSSYILGVVASALVWILLPSNLILLEAKYLFIIYE